MRLNKCFFIILFLFGSIGHTKIFRNAYISFEMPEAWQCVLEQTEWVCRSQSPEDSKLAIIILTAKEVGPTDSYELYKTHLNAPQNLKQKPGIMSKVIYPSKDVKINDQAWIDGLQLSSEVNNYFTRYMATIKDKIAILVTFSANQKYYTKFSQDFFKAIQSLRVVATNNLLSQPGNNQIRPGNEILGAPIGAVIPADMANADDNPDANNGNGSKTKTIFLAIAILLAALAGYIFYKIKNK